MKNRIYSFLAIAFSFLIISGISSSCKKDIDLTASGQELTIVYALLDKNDTRHYVRIQKAFLDKNKNAYEMAQVSDSIYYGNILTVTLIDVNTGVASTLSRTYGDTAGILKDSGLFSSSPNVLYAFNGSLNKDHRYRLSVKNTQTGNEAVSEIALVDNSAILFPIGGILLNPIDSSAINFVFNTGKNARVFDLVVRFNYQEWDISSPSIITNKYIEYTAFSGRNSQSASGNERLESKLDGRVLYSEIRNKIAIDPTKQRKINSRNVLEFTLYSGGQEFYNYILVKSAQSGITSGNDLPIYTNIENGLGIFSSRTSVKVGNVGMSGISVDSLVAGTKTKDLNFVR